MTSRQELIEQGARALQEHMREKVDQYVDGEPGWDDAEDWIREHRRDEVAAVISALDLAGIWDEGHSAGLIDGIADEDGLATNPYKETR